MITLELEVPPSVNHYFRTFRGRTVISATGKSFRRRVCWLLKARGVRPLPGPLKVSVDFYPPDQRRRDLDNLHKSLLDALQHGGTFFDDSQIVWLLTQKAQVIPGGKVVVTIWSVDEPGPQTCPCCQRVLN